MKFTIALTFFAAASALELKADDSEFMAALNTPIANLDGIGFECALLLQYVVDAPDQEAYADAIYAAKGAGNKTVKEILNVFGATVENKSLDN